MNNLSIGQIQDSISKEVTKCYAQTLGHGPKETRVYIIEDMAIIRLKGSLLPLEKVLLEGKEGIGLVKNIRNSLHEILTTRLSKIVENITKHKITSSHSDMSTKTGEILEVFILSNNQVAR
jgi:uncharacterized protein YbcI